MAKVLVSANWPVIVTGWLVMTVMALLRSYVKLERVSETYPCNWMTGLVTVPGTGLVIASKGEDSKSKRTLRQTGGKLVDKAVTLIQTSCQPWFVPTFTKMFEVKLVQLAALKFVLSTSTAM